PVGHPDSCRTSSTVVTGTWRPACPATFWLPHTSTCGAQYCAARRCPCRCTPRTWATATRIDARDPAAAAAGGRPALADRRGGDVRRRLRLGVLRGVRVPPPPPAHRTGDVADAGGRARGDALGGDGAGPDRLGMAGRPDRREAGADLGFGAHGGGPGGGAHHR